MGNNTIGYGKAAAIAILCNTALVWMKESSPAVMAVMKATPPFHHHWAIHGVVVLCVFIVLGRFFSKRASAGRQGTWITTLIAICTVLGALGIVMFYGNEALGHL